MERGLLWLPLLIVFFWLAWSGKKEYQKVEAYKTWAEAFEQSKYDIYSVLGKNGDLITWGKPTHKGIINQSNFLLADIDKIEIIVKNKTVDLNNLPENGAGNLQFLLNNNDIIVIPFTDINLTVKWFNYLQKFLNK